MARTIGQIRELAADTTMRMRLPSWNWSEGVALYGLAKLWLRCGDERIGGFIGEWFDRQLESDGACETVNATAPCFPLLEFHRRYPQERFAGLVLGRLDFLMRRAKRLGNGALEHTLVETSFGGQQWVDTLFMAGLFLAKAGFDLGVPAAVAEGLAQYRIHAKMQQGENGLFFHAWDENKQRVIGCRWARGNAWAAAVSVELLEMLPDGHEERSFVAETLRRLLAGLAEEQDPSGLWNTVIDEAWTYLETSAAAGIAYAVLKGVRLGIVSKDYLPMAERAWRAVLSLVDHTGVLKGVSSGTGVQNHPGEYHVIATDRLEGYGQGLLLMMLSELSDA